MNDWSDRRLHFIAIGGAGMSGLALVCHRLGARVSGSDRVDGPYMDHLRAAGLAPVVGHDAAAVPEDADVVISTAVGEDNPELAVARDRPKSVRQHARRRRDTREDHDGGHAGARSSGG